MHWGCLLRHSVVGSAEMQPVLELWWVCTGATVKHAEKSPVCRAGLNLAPSALPSYFGGDHTV